MEWTKEKIQKRLEEIKRDVEKEGISARGRKEILMFCEGKKMSASQAVRAFCYQCMGYHNNPGENRDCINPVCPLYPLMPYSSLKRKSRVMTEENKIKAAERLAAGRKSRLEK